MIDEDWKDTPFILAHTYISLATAIYFTHLAPLCDVHGADDVIDKDGEEEAGQDLDEDAMEPEIDALQEPVVRLGPLAEVHVVQGRVVVPDGGGREGQVRGG